MPTYSRVFHLKRDAVKYSVEVQQIGGIVERIFRTFDDKYWQIIYHSDFPVQNTDLRVK